MAISRRAKSDLCGSYGRLSPPISVDTGRGIRAELARGSAAPPFWRTRCPVCPRSVLRGRTFGAGVMDHRGAERAVLRASPWNQTLPLGALET
jgi:hypothetical protein